MLNGRYGPYVTNGKKNAKIPKDRDPKSITLEEAKVMIEQAPERGTGRFGRGRRPGGGLPGEGGGPAKAAATNGSGKREEKVGAPPGKARRS